MTTTATTTTNDAARYLATVIEVQYWIGLMREAAARDNGADVVRLARQIAARIEHDDE